MRIVSRFRHAKKILPKSFFTQLQHTKSSLCTPFDDCVFYYFFCRESKEFQLESGIIYKIHRSDDQLIFSFLLELTLLAVIFDIKIPFSVYRERKGNDTNVRLNEHYFATCGS